MDRSVQPPGDRLGHGRHHGATLVLEALNRALGHRQIEPDQLLIHTDQGSSNRRWRRHEQRVAQRCSRATACRDPDEAQNAVINRPEPLNCPNQPGSARNEERKAPIQMVFLQTLMLDNAPFSRSDPSQSVGSVQISGRTWRDRAQIYPQPAATARVPFAIVLYLLLHLHRHQQI